MDRSPRSQKPQSQNAEGRVRRVAGYLPRPPGDPGDGHPEPRNAWLAKERFLSLASYDPPISTRREQSGWMRCVIRAGGKSLTNTSLTTQVVSVQVFGR